MARIPKRKKDRDRSPKGRIIDIPLFTVKGENRCIEETGWPNCDVCDGEVQDDAVMMFAMSDRGTLVLGCVCPECNETLEYGKAYIPTGEFGVPVFPVGLN